MDSSTESDEVTPIIPLRNTQQRADAKANLDKANKKVQAKHAAATAQFVEGHAVLNDVLAQGHAVLNDVFAQGYAVLNDVAAEAHAAANLDAVNAQTEYNEIIERLDNVDNEANITESDQAVAESVHQDSNLSSPSRSVMPPASVLPFASVGSSVDAEPRAHESPSSIKKKIFQFLRSKFNWLRR